MSRSRRGSKIAVVDLRRYLPTGGPIEGKAGGVFVEGRAEPRGGWRSDVIPNGDPRIAAQN
jgi:hypothetical protein